MAEEMETPEPTPTEEPQKPSRFDISELKKDPKEFEKILADCEKLEAEIANPPISKHAVILGVTYETKFGERVAVVGSADFLGNWNLAQSFSLEWTPGNLWKGQYDFEGEPFAFEFKYVVVGETERWEPGSNRVFNCDSGVEANGVVTYDLVSNWQRVG